MTTFLRKSLTKTTFLRKFNKRTKKGQAALVAWVLLIGLSVALAVVVSTWTKKQAEETSKGIVSETEADLRCAGVSFNVAPQCEIPYDELKVVNRGDFTIHKFVVHIKPREGNLISNTINLFEKGYVPLKPGDTQTLKTQDSFMNSEIDLTPFIQINDQYVGCSTRKLITNC